MIDENGDGKPFNVAPLEIHSCHRPARLEIRRFERPRSGVRRDFRRLGLPGKIGSRAGYAPFRHRPGILFRTLHCHYHCVGVEHLLGLLPVIPIDFGDGIRPHPVEADVGLEGGRHALVDCLFQLTPIFQLLAAKAVSIRARAS